jgi:hypothetical protein
VRVFGVEDDEEDSPLDRIDDAEARFGSYRKLATSGQFRFLHPAPVSSARHREDNRVEDGGAVQ